jgi:hypothetical protein
MTYLFNNQQDFVPRMVDSATRLRVSNPLTLFEHNNQYGTTLLKWDILNTGTGALTDNANGSTTLSTGGGAINAACTRASRAYQHYQVGKSYYFGSSFNFGTGTTNVSKRVGLYDNNNGVFLEQNGSTINLNFRTNTSGSVVTTQVAQANWNVDTMQGTGPSGFTFNPNALNDFRIDFFGGFAIRCYLYGNGRFNLIHTVENASVTSPTNIGPATTNLTLRAEIVNLAAVTGANTMLVYNANLMSEGAQEQVPTYSFGSGNGTTTVAVTTRRPVFSIRANTTGPGRSIQNYGQVIPYSTDIYSDQSVYYELIVNGTLTGPSFSALSSQSLIMTDVSATGITGGMSIFTGYNSVSSGGFGTTTRATVISEVALYFPLVYSSLLNTQDTLTVVMTSVTGTSANCASSLAWVEYY